MATMELDDPARYGRVLRAADGSVEGVVETKAPGDATRAPAGDPRGQHGRVRVRGGALVAALERLEPANAQGEYYLPDVLPLMREAGRTIEAHVVTDCDADASGSTTASISPTPRELAQRRIHEALMRAGRHDRRPAHDVDRRRRRRSGADTVVEPGCVAPRRDRDRRGVRDRAAHDDERRGSATA